MSDPLRNLLSKLSGHSAKNSTQEEPWEVVQALEPLEELEQESIPDEVPEEAPVDVLQSDKDKSLEEMISRINSMASQKPAEEEETYFTPPKAEEPAEEDLLEDHDTPFYPCEPQTLREAQLTATDVEALVLKYLLTAGEASGREVAAQICLPFLILEECLRKMKYDQLVVYKDTAQAGDYVYFLTDLGRERARRYNEYCTYYGAAPVSLKDYIGSVRAQSLEGQSPNIDALEHAFEDLLINKTMFRRLGPAINSGRGLFLYGAPGNGKTSIAERVTRAFGRYIWVPRAIGIDGEILRVFDPAVHDEAPLEDGPGIMQRHRIDKRWVRIKRPTIVVGGELTMDNLEISTIQATGVSEAPLQLKSNCGTLVIDDFGRQRMSTDELLNRWIVPLEKRYDFLNMRGGKKIQVPFDQLIVFSTNLEPRDLCDDAFLRRIPYKIEVVDPTEEEFRQLFDIMCPLMGFTYDQDAIDHLVETHYRKVNRPFRCCQPRDLLLQVRNLCLYENAPLQLSRKHFDDAVENYFAVM